VGLMLSGVSLTANSQRVRIGAVLIGLGAGLSVAGLAGLVVAVSVSALSDEGLRQAAVWKSFTRYLHNVLRG
jgi:hypothetical protein